MIKLLPAMIWGLIITIISLLPGSSMPDLSWTSLLGLDKIGHMVVYTVLVILTAYGLKHLRKSRLLIKVIPALAIYGIMLEVCQNQMYLGRHFEVLDIIANIIGLFVGYFIARVTFKKD